MEHLVAALFTFFCPTWKAMLTEEKFEQLVTKFRKGTLDQELLEKVRCPLEDLKAIHFRFLKVLPPGPIAHEDEVPKFERVSIFSFRSD